MVDCGLWEKWFGICEFTFIIPTSEFRIPSSIAMPLNIKTVTSPQDLKRFIKLPFELYRGNPFWVPNLVSEERKLLTPGHHPFHEHAEACLFLAEDGGKTVGRISAHINHNHNAFHNDRVGFFGFFETIQSREVASALFEKASEFLREKGMDTMRGPMNFSTNETCGLLMNAFDEMPYIMMPYNPPFYAELIENAGFSTAKDLVCYHLDNTIFDYERIGKVAERIQKKSNITLRGVDLRRMEEEIKIIKKIYNSAWEKNWGFVPMTDAEFQHMSREMKTLLDPRLLYIAMRGNEPVGFILCLPDFNIVLKQLNGRLFPFGILKALWWKRKINRIRIITMGIVKEHRLAGIDILFYLKIAELCPKIGYPQGELGWVLEDNDLMNRAAEVMGSRLSKRYRIYDKKII